MAILDALKSVNTKTLAELQNVKDGMSSIFGPTGGFTTVTPGAARAVYPNAATLEIVFSSVANDFTFVGIRIYRQEAVR